MQRLLGKRASFVAVVVVAVVALSATVALAAPVLQPGQTSAPGMSGTCTDCHTYAKPAVAKPAVLMPSHPYLASANRRIGKMFWAWGYVPPKLAGTTDDTLTIRVQRYAKAKWTTVPSLEQTATLSTSGKFKNMTNYATKMTINRGGSYRMRSKLVYLDASSVAQTKYSTWKKFSVKK